MRITGAQALEKLSGHTDFDKIVFEHGTLTVEIYKPEKVDNQKPHTRDEVYIILAGSGTFYNHGNRSEFGPGDFLFVPAGKVHYFENFSDDFSTWVIFYGPEGGETPTENQKRI